MSQKKRKRERIPALSGSIETPPTMSFQLELKLQHYIIPKTSLWLIIPWEPGTHASHGVTDVAVGCKFTLLGSSVLGTSQGPPLDAFKPFPSSEVRDHRQMAKPFPFPAFGEMSPAPHPQQPTIVPHRTTAEPPQVQQFLMDGGAGICWCWQDWRGGEDVTYIAEQIHVVDKH